MPDPRIILLAAYQKNAAELLAIEASQEKLNGLILGIYSAGLTLITAFLKDGQTLLRGPDHTVSHFGWTLIAMAVLIGVYAIYMSTQRNNARHAVRQGLLQLDYALGFFRQGAYLRTEQLYPEAWKQFPNRGFLDWSHLIVALAGTAFVLAVYFIAAGTMTSAG